MEVKYINPFIESFNSVMPQLGFGAIKIGKLSLKSKEVWSSGVLVVLGIVGDIRGNVIYTLDVEAAKQIASTMMMGAPVDIFDEMAKSALSELTNMLTANAATVFAADGIASDISTPTLLYGKNLRAQVNADPILCIPLVAGDISIDLNVAFEH